MTRIDFYHYAEDKLRFACRLAALACERDKRVLAYASDTQVLDAYDRLLWTYQSVKFVPHCRAHERIAQETPVLLAADGEHLPHHDVLLNLDAEWPPFFATFERVLEIVSTDEDDQQRARGRYAFYKKRGYEVRVNAIEA